MRSLIPFLAAPPLDPTVLAILREAPALGGRSRRLVVVHRADKLMSGALCRRDGRIRQAMTAPLMICTHRATGKRWPADHSTSRMRRSAR